MSQVEMRATGIYLVGGEQGHCYTSSSVRAPTSPPTPHTHSKDYPAPDANSAQVETA